MYPPIAKNTSDGEFIPSNEQKASIRPFATFFIASITFPIPDAIPLARPSTTLSPFLKVSDSSKPLIHFSKFVKKSLINVKSVSRPVPFMSKSKTSPILANALEIFSTMFLTGSSSVNAFTHFVIPSITSLIMLAILPNPLVRRVFSSIQPANFVIRPAIFTAISERFVSNKPNTASNSFIELLNPKVNLP